jgi:uncharacterized protein
MTRQATHQFRTHSGRLVDFLRPKPEDISIEDIAHHLAQVNRFGGAPDVPYSVASHCVYVSRRLQETHPDEPGLWLAGLLHDASEAYLGDVVSGLKSLLVEYRALETVWERLLERVYGVRWHGVEAVKEADVRARLAEARDLFRERPRGAGQTLTGQGYGHLTAYDAPVVPESAADAEWAFLQRAAELGVLLDVDAVEDDAWR